MTEERYDYAWQRQRLEECRAKGLGFGATLAVLDSQVRTVPSYLEKIRFLRPRAYHGVEIVNIPHMGAWTEVPLDAAVAMVRMVLCEHLQRLM
jgi:hypothetical protein